MIEATGKPCPHCHGLYWNDDDGCARCGVWPDRGDFAVMFRHDDGRWLWRETHATREAADAVVAALAVSLPDVPHRVTVSGAFR